MTKTRVLICDDSAIVRDILTKELSQCPDIEVVGSAIDPYIAREKLSKLEVDVMLLDVEMPRMDGITFLRYLMKYRPIPVIILSSLVDGTNQASMEALELGAVDIVPKPGGPFSVTDVIDLLITRIREARHVDFSKVQAMARQIQGEDRKPHQKILSRIQTTNKLIAIGASTGGTTALETVFRSYDRILPPTVVVIHMPERFTTSFAKRLDDLCSPHVKEAEDGETALPGCVYIAPGNYHLTVRLVGSEYRLRLQTAPKLHGQRPAVDPLFDSVAREVGRNALGIIMTGMGKDGAQGLLSMRQQGAHTICQDEESCIVFGMPKVAIELGAASEVVSLKQIYTRLSLAIDAGVTT